MPTKTPLYPNGFEFTDQPLTDFLDTLGHSTVIPRATAASTYWQQCTATVVITITINDYPSVGDVTVIGATLDGHRQDFFAAEILNTNPRALIGVAGRKTFTEDFASPMEFPPSLITGQAFGPDNDYSASYTFKGIMYFNATEAVPFILCAVTMTSSNGALFQISVAEPGGTDKVAGQFLTIDGQAYNVWFAWSGASIPTSADPQMSAVVTTTSFFVWPT